MPCSRVRGRSASAHCRSPTRKHQHVRATAMAAGAAAVRAYELDVLVGGQRVRCDQQVPRLQVASVEAGGWSGGCSRPWLHYGCKELDQPGLRRCCDSASQRRALHHHQWRAVLHNRKTRQGSMAQIVHLTPTRPAQRSCSLQCAAKALQHSAGGAPPAGALDTHVLPRDAAVRILRQSAGRSSRGSPAQLSTAACRRSQQARSRSQLLSTPD